MASKYCRITVLFIIFILPLEINAQQKPRIYLFPGQGSDYRIFKNLHFPVEYDTVCISYPLPRKDECLKDFAAGFVNQIDTTAPVMLIGVSMGGMICTELADYFPNAKVIIVSSAKCRDELPRHYRFQAKVPINEYVPPTIVKAGALFLQPIVEPDRNTDKACFKAMLSSKSPDYLKRSVHMIINWNRRRYSDHIIHIHGTADHTLPIKNIRANYIISNGSHMMTLTRAEELQKILDSLW